MAAASGPQRHESERLYDIILPALSNAYPEMPEGRLEHTARNLVQVVGGVIDIGRRLSVEDAGPLTHMDASNSMVFWCVWSTRLEEYCEQDASRSRKPSGPVIPREEALQLRREICARVADWLAVATALEAEPDLYRAFVRGTLAMGTSEWERERGALDY